MAWPASGRGREARPAEIQFWIGGPRLSARRAVLLLSTLLGVFAVGLFAVAAEAQRRAAIADATDGTWSLARVLAEHAGRVLDGSDLALDQAIALAEGRSWDEVGRSAEGHARLQRVVGTREWLEALWLTDQDGMPRLTSRRFPAPPIDTSDRPYFIAQRERDQGPLLSALVLSRVTGQPNVVLARRVNGPQGEFRGIAQAVLDPDYFRRLYQSSMLRPGTEIVVFRDDLSISLRFPTVAGETELSLTKWPDQGPLPAAPLAGSLTSVSAADGIERIESYRRIPGFPAYVSVGVPRAGVLGDWRRKIAQQAALAGAALAGFLALTAVALQRIRREERAYGELEQRVAERTQDLEVALKERDLLMDEMNHRIKNNLQLASSLLGLQIGRTENETARNQLGQARARLHAIADLHGHLYATASIDTIDAQRYFGDLCRELEATVAGNVEGRRVTARIDPIDLPVDQVVPLGLILTELVTNACKHGFTSAQPCLVDVVLERRDGHLRLVVGDEGVGLPAGSPPAGFGISLVRSLTEQLGGELRFEPVEKGTRVVIDVPAAA